MKLNLAALRALIDGDADNFFAASTPGGIEKQEKQGQADFVSKEILPIKFQAGTRQDMEFFGVVYGNPVDDLFIEATLPEGWKKEPTDHSMWSKLVDEQGRERASIFYKAAFYDREAFISLSRRFTYSVAPTLGWDKAEESPWACVVMDGGKVIWQSDKIVEPQTSEESDYKVFSDWMHSKQSLEDLGIEWLESHYPDYKSLTAYWKD